MITGSRFLGALFAVMVAVVLGYIVWQYASDGRQAAQMAKLLEQDLAAVGPPRMVDEVTRDKGWRPHRAHASIYYHSDLSIAEIKDYYDHELLRSGWTRGARSARGRPRPAALIYHSGDRDFMLMVGSKDAGWTYSTALVWNDY